jgi:hypothetical protein
MHNVTPPCTQPRHHAHSHATMHTVTPPCPRFSNHAHSHATMHTTSRKGEATGGPSSCHWNNTCAHLFPPPALHSTLPPTLMIVSMVSSSCSVVVMVSSTSPSTMFRCSSYACRAQQLTGTPRAGHVTHSTGHGASHGHSNKHIIIPKALCAALGQAAKVWGGGVGVGGERERIEVDGGFAGSALRPTCSFPRSSRSPRAFT